MKDSTMKPLLIVTAVIELGAGVALLAAPAFVSEILLGVRLDTPAVLTVSRIAGAALLALGVACWIARDDGRSRAAFGLIAAMLVYNFGAAATLAYAGLGNRLVGIALWPGVALHVVMGVWCLACLRPVQQAHAGNRPPTI
jgi:hypothetical protein